jgi:uncharacterized membrane protein YjjB (DUF3815 family)
MLWASIGALGFAVLFQVPRHCLPFCAALGALGYGARTLLLNSSVDLILCSFAGAVLVGFAGYGLSIRYRVPSTLYTVPGIIPLVPGSIAFQSMVTLIRAIDAGPDGASTLLMSAAFDALTAGLIIFSIGVGISTPFLLFRRQKPVV